MKNIKSKNYFTYYEENTSPSSSNITLIYFDHAGDRSSDPVQLNEDAAIKRIEKILDIYIKKYRYVFCILPKICNWYQSEDIYDVLDEINSMSEQIYMLGFSMGGFAAINYSYYCKAKFISFQPQFKLEEYIPLTPFYKKCLKNIIHVFTLSNIESGKNIKSEGLVFFDPCNDVDSYHSRKISGLTKSELFEIPYAGHSCSSEINKFYRIYNLVDDYICGRFNSNRFKSLITKDRILKFYGYFDKKLKYIINEYNYLLASVDLSLTQKIECLYNNNLFYEVLILVSDFISSNSNLTINLNFNHCKYILHSVIKTKKYSEFTYFESFCMNNITKNAYDYDNEALSVIYTSKLIYLGSVGNKKEFLDLYPKLIILNAINRYYKYNIKFLKIKFEQYGGKYDNFS